MQVSNESAGGSPLKQRVRDWMQQRQEERTAPPTPEEIRRQLGWHLVTKAPECVR